MQTINTEWENINENIKFPFDETTSLKADSGAELPLDVVCDMLVCVNKANPDEATEAHVTGIKLTPNLLSLSLETSDDMASCIVMKADFVPHQPVLATSLNGRMSAYITFGDFEWPTSPIFYRFSSGAAKLDSRAVVALPAAKVTHLVEAESGQKLTGDVTIHFPKELAHAWTTSSDGVTTFILETNTKYLGILNNADNTSSLGNTQGRPCGSYVVTSINGVKPNNDGIIGLRFM